MKAKEFTLNSEDNTGIHIYEWLPDNKDDIKAVVQIAHGMAEQAGRYGHFAEFLCNNGFAVYANDHRGHGKTAGDLRNVGYIAKKQGWDKLVGDIELISNDILKKHAEKPLFLMGHSMGSFAVRTCLITKEIPVSGAIISGTADDPGLLGVVGKILTRFMMIFYAGNHPSPLLDNMSFGAFNKPFQPNRTKFDWLSRDNEQVDKYVQDPYCGGVFSLKFFNDMLGGLLFASKVENMMKMNHDLPLLMFSGDQDPVGGQGKGVKAVYHKFKKAGMKDITFKLFEGGRHEMINETNNEEVYDLVVDWLKKQL